jgi:hypothetical protein
VPNSNAVDFSPPLTWVQEAEILAAKIITPARVHTHTLTHTLTHAHTRTRTYTPTHALIHTRTHSHIYTQAHSHTHTCKAVWVPNVTFAWWLKLQCLFNLEVAVEIQSTGEVIQLLALARLHTLAWRHLWYPHFILLISIGSLLLLPYLFLTLKTCFFSLFLLWIASFVNFIDQRIL